VITVLVSSQIQGYSLGSPQPPYEGSCMFQILWLIFMFYLVYVNLPLLSEAVPPRITGQNFLG